MADKPTENTDPLAEINEKFDALEAKATEFSEKLEATTDEEAAEQLRTDMKAITDEVEVLKTERRAAAAEAEADAMRSDLKSVVEGFEELRKAPESQYGFNPLMGGQVDPASGEESEKAVYGEKAEHSFYADVKGAKGGSAPAWERLQEGKAMVEGKDTAGGFLVPPEISDELIRVRDATGVLRGLIPSHGISVDELRIGAVDNGLAVAWTAELSEKIQSEFTFSELSANVFTAAGLAVASNQLLADSKFAIDQMINSDLAKRFVALEEQAFLNGSGTGQPRGVRQTAGVESIPYPSASSSARALADKIVDAITKIHTDYFGAPDGIVMHPRTWGYLIKAREEGTPGSYVLGPPSTIYGRNPADPIPGYSSAPLPKGELFGVPVYTTPNVPTNLGSSTEESVVYVANWGEGLILDREGITTAQSEHVFFTSNQTVFRAEERVGFTAARYPKAFKVIEGAGLKGV